MLSVKEPYSHIIGFQLTAAAYRIQSEKESQQELERERERRIRERERESGIKRGGEYCKRRQRKKSGMDSVTHRTRKHFTI